MATPAILGRSVPQNANGFGIREARRQDVSAVSALWKEMMDFHLARDARFKFESGAVREFEQHFLSTLRSRDAQIFVAESHGQVVGYILGEMHSRKPLYPIGKYGFISDLSVRANHRRIGIGRALADRLMEWFRKKGATAIELFIAESNPVSDAFWKSIGFEGFLRLSRLELTGQTGAR